MSSLPGKKVKLNPNNAVHDHLIHCNYLPSFDNFSILVHENKKFLFKIKESIFKECVLKYNIIIHIWWAMLKMVPAFEVTIWTTSIERNFHVL